MQYCYCYTCNNQDRIVINVVGVSKMVWDGEMLTSDNVLWYSDEYISNIIAGGDSPLCSDILVLILSTVQFLLFCSCLLPSFREVEEGEQWVYSDVLMFWCCVLRTGLFLSRQSWLASLGQNQMIAATTADWQHEALPSPSLLLPSPGDPG